VGAHAVDYCVSS